MWVSREDKYGSATGKLDEGQAAKTQGMLIVKNCIYRINETGVRLGMTVAIKRSECADSADSAEARR